MERQAVGAQEAPPSWNGWEKTFLFMTAALASTILLKVGQIQYLELLYALQIVVVSYSLRTRSYSVTLPRPLFQLGVSYAAVMIVATALSVWALQYDFFFPEELSVLKYPVVIALSRSAELFASVFVMIYLSNLFRRDAWKARFTMRVYFWTGVASGLYSLISWPLQRVFKVSLGTYNVEYRWRGFYNEGGPYGLYLISVILVGFALYRMRWERAKWVMAAFVLLLMALLGSRSKAAVVALLFLGLINTVRLRTAARKVAAFAVVAVVLSALSYFVDLPRQLRLYREASQAYERASHMRAHDPNVVLGRVAGAFIVPRMIAAHPLVGVGWGNYGLVRNAPEYRGASAWAMIADEPSLGLFGTASELGVPLTLMLCATLFFPYVLLRRWRVPLSISNLALLQPLVQIFGAQLNTTFPWVVTSFALGISLSLRESEVSPEGEAVARFPRFSTPRTVTE